MLIDAALLGDRKIIKKEAEKIFKYIELIPEIHNLWNVEAKVMPVIIWANELYKITQIIPCNVSEKHKINEIQKQSHWALDTTADSANVKVKTYLSGEVTL